LLENHLGDLFHLAEDVVGESPTSRSVVERESWTKSQIISSLIVWHLIFLTVFVLFVDEERGRFHLDESQLEVVVGIVQIHDELAEFSGDARDGASEALSIDRVLSLNGDKMYASRYEMFRDGDKVNADALEDFLLRDLEHLRRLLHQLGNVALGVEFVNVDLGAKIGD
jgi:hypothetical protein